MQTADKYRRDSLDGGIKWGTGYQFRGEDGKPGENGSNGTDASVTFANIKSALQKAASTQTTFITADSAGSPNIYGGNIYGANIYAGRGSDSFASMDEDGFKVYVNGVSRPKLSLDSSNSGDLIQLVLGAGGSSTWQDIFRIQKAANYCGLYYWDLNGVMSGFRFHQGGEIEVLGDLSVTAVFA